MKRISFIIFSIFFVGCGGLLLPDMDSISSYQPRVLSIAPEDGAYTASGVSIQMSFSAPLEPLSIDRKSVVVSEINEGDMRDDFIAEVEDQSITGIAGRYELSEQKTEITFIPDAPFLEGKRYLVVVSTKVLSDRLVPLSQNPARASSPFVSEFYVVGEDVIISPDGTPVFSPDAGGGEVAVDRNRPQNLLINEVMYDASGSDTGGDVFVELIGDPSGDITDYKVYLINGDDGVIKDTMHIPENSLIGDDGIFLIADSATGSSQSKVQDVDFVSNFDPQNGPDCIQLVDDKENLIDALGYGEPIVELAENGLICFKTKPAEDVAGGFSLTRVDDFDTGDNSLDFISLDLPTPGFR